MSKNARLEQDFKNDIIMNDDMIFANHNETDILIREEAQYLASQMNSSRYFDSLENNDVIPKDLYENIINEKLLVDANNQNKICSVIEKNNTLLNKLLDKIDDDSRKMPIAGSADNKEIFVIDKENSFYEHTEKNNSILIDYFKNEISNIRELMKNDKLDINETNKEILYYLENELVVNDVLNNKEIFDKIDKNIDDKLVKNNSILNKNLNVWIEEVISKIQDLKDNLTKMNYREELDYLLNAQSNNESSIVKVKEEVEKNIESSLIKNNSTLNRSFNSLIEEFKYEIQDIKTEIKGLNYREELDELLHIQNKNENSIDVMTKDIDSRIDELEDELKKLNYRKELDGLLEAQFHYIENANSSKKEIQEKINYIENDFLERIQNIEYKLSSNLNIINELKNSHDSNEIDNLITDKLVTIVEEKINTIDSKMMFLKKEIENNLNNLIEKQFETNIVKSSEYNKKIKNETLNIIYNELNKFNNKFENLNEEIIKNYDLLMINNRVLDTLEDLLSDQYSKKNDLDVERKNLIDELIKKAEHNKELIIILQNKIDYSIDNTDLYNSIIRKTISRDSDFLREVDDQTYNYVKNLTLELVSKELSKYTNFVKNDAKELEVEQIELNLTDESYENKIDNSNEILDLDVLDQILDNDEITKTKIDNSEDTRLEDFTPMISEEEIIDEEEIVEPTIIDEPIVDNEDEIVEPTIIDEPFINDNEEIIEPTIDDKEEIIESIIIDESIIDNKEKVIEDIQLDKNEKQEPIDSNLDIVDNTSKSVHNDDKIFRNSNPYFNYKIKELLLELMNNENESITNDIAFYRTNLLNQNSDYLNSEFYVQELENYFSTVKNTDEDNFNQGEPNG